MDYYSPRSLLALSVVFLVTTTILVTLRVVSREAQRARLGPDDYTTIVAWILMVTMCTVTIMAVGDGLWGVDLPFLDPDADIQDDDDVLRSRFSDPQAWSGHYDFANTVVFTLQIVFVKLSVIFFLRRIFVVVRHGYMHWATLTMIVFVSIWGIAFFFQGLFQCPSNFSLNWTGSILAQKKHCQSPIIGLVLHGIDPLTDVVIMILPMWSIWTLHMSTSKKLAVAGVFSVGALSVAASFVRLVCNIQIIVGYGDEDSYSYNILLSQSEFWQLFESGFAVIAACLPTVQYLFRRPVVKEIVNFGSYTSVSAKASRTAASSEQELHRLERPTSRYALEAWDY